jgi:hypothetical protein
MEAVAASGDEMSPRKLFKLLLPKEHGSWSLAMEPLAFGLLAAPAAAGGALAIAALAGFFLRRPIRSLFREPAAPQRQWMIFCAIGLTAIAIAGLWLAAQSGGAARLWPLIPAALAGIAFVWFDSRNEARAEAAELSGAVAFGILSAAFGALAGWNVVESAALALVMLSRSVPTVIYARTYMRLRKGRAAARLPAFIAVVVALLLLAWLAAAKIAPWPAAIFGILLAARTFWLLGNSRPKFPAKVVGFTELILGLAMVLTVALAWRFF